MEIYSWKCEVNGGIFTVYLIFIHMYFPNNTDKYSNLNSYDFADYKNLKILAIGAQQ
jgi:hypothetical protein